MIQAITNSTKESSTNSYYSKSIIDNKLNKIDKTIRVLHKRDDDLYDSIEYEIKEINFIKNKIKNIEIALIISNVGLIILGLAIIFKLV